MISAILMFSQGNGRGLFHQWRLRYLRRCSQQRADGIRWPSLFHRHHHLRLRYRRTRHIPKLFTKGEITTHFNISDNRCRKLYFFMTHVDRSRGFLLNNKYFNIGYSLFPKFFYFAPLRLLHSRHNIWQFSTTVRPPSRHGVM